MTTQWLTGLLMREPYLARPFTISLLLTAIDLSLVGTFTYEEGAVDNAISSAATGNYLTTGGDVDALDLSRDEDFTISCWVKYASSCMIASKMESSGNYRGGCGY